MAKRRAKSAREGEDKPFGGYTVNNTHGQLRQRGNTDSAVPSPLQNQILDLLEGYTDNISAAVTQAFAKGGPLAELSSSLEISIDTVVAQQK